MLKERKKTEFATTEKKVNGKMKIKCQLYHIFLFELGENMSKEGAEIHLYDCVKKECVCVLL